MSFDRCNLICNKADPLKLVSDGFEWSDSSWIEYRRRAYCRFESCELNIYELDPTRFFPPNGCFDIKVACDAIAAYSKKMGYTHLELPVSSLENPQMFVNFMHESGIGVIAKIDIHFMTSMCQGERFDLSELVSRFHFDGVHISGKSFAASDFSDRINFSARSLAEDVFVIADEDLGNFDADFFCNLPWTKELYNFLSGEHNDDVIERVLQAASDPMKIAPMSHSGSAESYGMLIDRIKGDYDDKFRIARTAVLLEMCMPAKKLMFMGTEYAQFVSADAAKSLEWFMLDFSKHHDFREYISSLNNFYLEHRELSAGGYRRLNARSFEKKSDIVAFERAIDERNKLIIVLSFADFDTRVAVDILADGEPKILFDTCGENAYVYSPVIHNDTLHLYMPRKSGIVLTFDNKIIELYL